MQTALRQEWQLFLLAIQFLTRLPIPASVPYSDDLSRRAVRYYPVVGICVGLVGAAVLLINAQVFSPTVAVLYAIAATVALTGGMHEDGLADLADGLGGGQNQEQTLEIMRDSHIGVFGFLTLGLTMALRVALLVSLPIWGAAAAIVLGHGVGRMAAVHIIATLPYARARGTKFVAPNMTPEGYRVALASTGFLLLAAVLVFGPIAVLLSFCMAVIFAQVLRYRYDGRIGGYTGDCLGGTILMAELGVYVGLALWL